jgi:DNA ligase-1
MKPMLAGNVDFKKLKFPVMASAKLDGIRALIIDGQVFSRKLLLIPNGHVQDLFGHSELNGLDGELIVGPAYAEDAYRKTMSGVMSKYGEPEVTYHVFDDFSLPQNLGYAPRYNALQDRLRKTRFAHLGENITVVPHLYLENMDQLLETEAAALAKGYEGIMLRSLAGPYKQGRSTANEGWLLKVKRFADSEAEIVGYEELLHNANEATIGELGQTKRSSHKANKQLTGKLGALQVRDLTTGETFSVGTGFDDAQRWQYWQDREALLGKLITYKYFPSGNLAAPRFPTFKGFRDKSDVV